MKKTKLLTRIGAVVFALAILFAMAVPAMADEAGDVYTGNSQTTTSGTNIPITKSIIFINIDAEDVYEPNITYTYTATPVDPNGATVTDTGGDVAVVNEGVANGVAASTIAFSSNNGAVDTYATGNEIEKSTNLAVDLSQFTHAGIYRYVVTETSNPADPSDVGITPRTSNYDNTRYLDVYIGNNPSGTGFVLSGAVFFKTVETTAGSEGTDSIDTAFEKTAGFEPGTAGTPGTTDYTNDETVDRYTTYNFSVKKEVAGTLADKTHEFPFYLSISNTISGAKFTYSADSGEAFTGATNSSGVVTTSAAAFTVGADSKNSSLTLKHGDQVDFVGVPSNQTTALAIVVKEFNDSVDAYTPTVTATNGTIDMASGAQMAASTGYDSTTSFDIKSSNVADQIITVTNTISEISPTGLAFRIAPYVLMLAAGVSLIVLFIKRKRETTDMI